MRRKRRKSNLIVTLCALLILALLLGVAGWYWQGQRQRATRHDSRSAVSSAKTSVKKVARSEQPSQASSSRTIDQGAQQKLEATLDENNFVGTGLLVRNGEVVALYSRGYADFQSKRLNTPNTTYQINSMQKCLTGFLVMKQVEAGKVALTDHLAKYFPQVPGSAQITLAQMMQMTSGLSMASMGSGAYESDADVLQRDLAQVQFSEANFGHANYQPVNFVLLAGIVEKVSGKSYRQLFQEQLIAPLGLKQTYFGYEITPQQVVATGYTAIGNQSSYQEPTVLSSAQQHYELGTGQIFMSVLDCYRAVRAISAGKLLPAALTAQQFQGGLNHYTGGMYNTEPFRSANGGGAGFCSTIHITPNGENAVVLLSNQSAATSWVSKLATILEPAAS
ncbi:serine hydrolase domain-containing protein [Lapidilactobacillus luobeiensis]|uniref:serine hydrolase domain-containing protein n=1 Tax=Lapidilactobacillus luobeiensis TaxID=2950371 RepID=UPI0021C36E14|nr:serine hydrolase domain-containing protein [Lapidilactobacillus luobeiensis]